MAEGAWDAFCGRVAWSGDFHARFTATAQLPSTAAELASANERHASVLMALSALMERRVDNPDEDSAISQDMARLDAKLNVLIEIVNRLLLPESALPTRTHVKFNATGAWLPDVGGLQAGDSAALVVHFDGCRALPLELPGTVQAGPQQGTFLAFQGLSDTVRQEIERLVFRQHRRQIAEARAGVSISPSHSSS
jgi:hypothetical protein